MWWRVLIPSWRFFDVLGARAELWVQRDDTDWERIASPPPRTWFMLFFNPTGNYAHACNNLFERLLQEATVSASIAGLVSYRLVTELSRKSAGPAARFRFKLMSAGEEALLSPWLEGRK